MAEKKKTPIKKTPTRKKTTTKKKTTTRRSAGRPKKTVYDKKYCEMLVEHYAQGLDFKSFAGFVGVSRSTLYEWVKSYPEFKEAKEKGSDMGYLFHLRNLTNIATGVNRGNVAAQMILMRNLFGWRATDDNKEKEETKVEISLKYDAGGNKNKK